MKQNWFENEKGINHYLVILHAMRLQYQIMRQK